MSALEVPGLDQAAVTENVMIISVDSHAGPPLEVLREYCPSAYLDDFDDFTKAFNASAPSILGAVEFDMLSDAYVQRLIETLGRPLMHYDPYERLHDMDADGIAAEVVYHGALNGAPLPFISPKGFDAMPSAPDKRAAELAAEGLRIYNRWVRDYCSVAPERRRGIAQLPFWDLETALTDLEAACEAGLRAINLPVPRPGLPGHNNLLWEPIWSACESLGMSLNCHGGSATVDHEQLRGENTARLLFHELLHLSRRALSFMILGGVFERHPNLTLVLTEQPGAWLRPALNELDAVMETTVFRSNGSARRPSDYFSTNCYIGASFMSNADVQSAVEGGFSDRFMWGADYPHVEGTFPHSIRSLRLALEGIGDEVKIRKMLGKNALDVYGFDEYALRVVAAKIGPTLDVLRTPLDPGDIPPNNASMGFRTGAW